MGDVNITSEPPKDNFTQSLNDIMKALSEANQIDEEDPSQKALIRAIQKHREFILNVTTQAYIKNPNNPKLLDALNSLVSNLEKSVRDDRKERERAKDKEENRASFSQMVEALKQLSNNTISVPTWSQPMKLFDPNESFTTITNEDFTIKPDELSQGIITLDFDGNKVN